MKKILLIFCIIAGVAFTASAQLLPSFQFGIKGGVNLTSLSSGNTFNNDNKAGYLAGLWARVGGAGLNFQPELYITSKNVNINSDGTINKAKFTSIDVPLLVGTKVGALGFGGRFYTGPLLSFSINKDQSFSNAAGNALRLNYKDQNVAWQFGAGLDIQKISVDLRYELGITKQNYYALPDTKTRVSLFNLSLGYKLF